MAKRFTAIVLSCALATATFAQPIEPTEPAPGTVTVETLAAGDVVEGFSAEAVYVNDRDEPVGARFRHQDTGFVLDYLQIESVPQAFIWAGTYPESDRGEPHTQEHLLLGKGNRGRAVANQSDMALVRSSAFTDQARTAYHFQTSAGIDVFFDVLDQRLGALLLPDYTDEEIRREVHHFSVTADDTGDLRLEEGGTVYNEMVSSYQRPVYRIWREAMGAAYGPMHPLALSAGGWPEAIREMTPEHIRTFHRDHYQLFNMGLIAMLPEAASLAHSLARINLILRRFQAEATPAGQDVLSEEDLPPAEPASSHTLRRVPFPDEDPNGAVDLELVFPATLDLDPTEYVMLSTFLETLASDANSDLYRLLVDSETRRVDIGATEVSAYVADWPGHPVLIGVAGMSADRMTDETVAQSAEIIRDALRHLAQAEAGSAELADFNRRFLSRLAANQRARRHFVDSPPEFGIRGTGSDWMDLLDLLDRAGGERRPLTLQPMATAIEAELASEGNAWSERLARWGLLDREPYVLVSQPSPELLESLQAERDARIRAETERLMAEYGVTDAQEAIGRYRDAYAENTAELEALAAAVEVPPFTESPPMTLDDALTYEVGEIAGGVPRVWGRFDNLSGATVGLALRLDGLPQEDWVALGLIASLFDSVGVIEGERRISYPEMLERLQNEVLSLNVSVDANIASDRLELLVTGSGTNEGEARAAIEWMTRVLFHPDWSPENLPRIRDLIDERLEALRRTGQLAEEQWVNDPELAYRQQHDPLYLSADSYLTRMHHLQRLRWLLREADATQLGELDSVLSTLETATHVLDRDGLRALLNVFSGEATERPTTSPDVLAAWDAVSPQSLDLIREFTEDLRESLADYPDADVGADTRYLMARLRADLAMPPQVTLDAFQALADRVLTTGRARLWLVAGSTLEEALRPDLERLIGQLADRPHTPSATDGPPTILDRVRQRGALAADEVPVFVGLVSPDIQGGVFLHSAPNASYGDIDRDILLDLTGRLYGGGGGHSIFMKTWSAGLAYSNGIRSNIAQGTIGYYAERCPELPQTLRFVIDQLRAVEVDPSLADYALAQAFASRSGLGYPDRVRALAADLADGITPETVTAFRQALLDLRQEDGLAETLFDRIERVYGEVLPGLGPAAAEVAAATYFVIGTEDHLATYEAYLESLASGGGRLLRLYPRDFWLVEAAGLDSTLH